MPDAEENIDAALGFPVYLLGGPFASRCLQDFSLMHIHLTNHDRQTPRGPHYPTSLPKVKLEIIRGVARNMMRPIEVPVFLIGTAGDCDMVLGDPEFPEAHMYLMVTEEGVSLRWLGVGPEVTVGGRQVETALLMHDDCIRTSHYEFRVHIEAPQEKPTDRKPHWGQTGEGPQKTDSPDALRAVRCLMEDLRSTLYPPSSRLRLYVEPDASNCPDSEEKKASA